MNNICFDNYLQSKIYFDVFSYLPPSDAKPLDLFIRILGNQCQKEISEISSSFFSHQTKKLLSKNSFFQQLFLRVHNQSNPYSFFWDFHIFYHGRQKMLFSPQIIFCSSGGAILSLSAKERENEFTEIQNALFPAVQRYDEDIEQFFSSFSKELKDSFLFCGIQYFEKEKRMLIPDPVFLSNRLKILIPDISIHYSKGILNDYDFIKSFLANDFIISVDEEHFHDISIHVCSQLKMMLEDLPRYRKARASLRSLILGDLKKIQKKFSLGQEQDKMLALLGALVDSSLALSKISVLEAVREPHIFRKKETILKSIHWRRYFQKRFYPEIKETNLDFIEKEFSSLLDKLYL